jgi:Cu2+-exporting ATPase
MVQNLWWAAGYNIFAIPLAAGALTGLGVIIDPAVGAIFMSLSTVLVAINSQTLRRYVPVTEERIIEKRQVTAHEHQNM